MYSLPPLLPLIATICWVGDWSDGAQEVMPEGMAYRRMDVWELCLSWFLIGRTGIGFVEGEPDSCFSRKMLKWIHPPVEALPWEWRDEEGLSTLLATVVVGGQWTSVIEEHLEWG